jgi:uncharacterized membrane protein
MMAKKLTRVFVRIRRKVRFYFLTGLLAVVPLMLTVMVVRWLVGWIDGSLYRILPKALRPEELFGFYPPGFSLLVGLVVILLIGMVVANYFGKLLFQFAERFMYRIPLVKSIYNLFKQVADTTIGKDARAFRRVILIEYPRKGIWSIGFATGITKGEVQDATEKKVINVFVPTTPNPTSGFYILVPEEDTVPLTMTVEDAFKLIVSGGMVTPKPKKDEAGKEPPVLPTPVQGGGASSAE